MPNISIPAAAIGLPSNIILFPMRRPAAGFEPTGQQLETAVVTLCIAWQFSHLDQAGTDHAIEKMVRADRHGALRMVRENVDAIRWLYEAADFLSEVDTRMQESLSRGITKLEAN